MIILLWQNTRKDLRMRLNMLILIAMFILLAVNLFSCSHRNTEERSKVKQIITRDYKLISDYKFTSPGKDVVMYRVSDWDKWFVPFVTHKYNSPEWIVKRKDIKVKEVSGRTYTSIDGSYELSLPFLSSKKMYFSDKFVPHNSLSFFLAVDENNWVIGIQVNEIMKDPKYTKYYNVRSPDEVMPLVGGLGQGHAGDVVSQNDGRYIPVITKYFKYDGVPVFEEYVRCAGGLDSPENLVNSIGYGKCTTIKHLKRQLVKNGYLYAISVYVECKSENEDECHTEEKVYELADYVLKNIKFLKKADN